MKRIFVNLFLICLQTVVTKYLRQKGGRIYAIFVDFEKAFDRIDRNMLWNKLNSLHISSKMLKMLKSIYSEVKYCVKYDTELTDYFDCTNGVRQGCAISPILFCFFLNDLKDYVTEDSHGIDLYICKLFLLMFADDLVLFADSKVGLQRLINKLAMYCKTFKLKVNLGKTNIIVFRNGGYLSSYEKWYFEGIPIRVVTYYKYLGLVVSSRLSWYACQKTLAEQASKALFAVKRNLMQLGTLSVDLLFKIFDTKILPILTYGAEIWCNHEGKDVEKVHHDFCKYVLKVSRLTPNVFVRGELGRYTIDAIRTEILVKYWLKLLHMPNERLPKICYNLQCRWLEANPRTNCWAKDVKDTLLAWGFGYAWYNQGVGNIPLFLSHFKERNRDIDIGSWQHDVQNMDSLRTYKLLKTYFGCERYLKDIKTSSFKQILVKFRGGLLDLRANSGKFEGLSIERRFCKLCNTAVENEYHFLFVCSYYGSLRKQFLPDYFVTPVENILFTLLCTLHQPNSIDQCLFLAVVNFILAATQVRYF